MRELTRWVQLVAGLFLYGVAAPLMIRGDLGLGPWDAFHVGVNLLTGISVGSASILVGVIIVSGCLAVGMKPGVGTIANMVLIGVFIDLILPWVPPAEGIWEGIVYHLTGIGLVGLSTGMYIAPRLGAGPRDALLLGVSRRTRRSVRLVRTCIEIAVLLAGWAMGATLGLGTILFALLIGPSTQLGLQLFGVIPARVTPEDLRAAAPPPIPSRVT